MKKVSVGGVSFSCLVFCCPFVLLEYGTGLHLPALACTCLYLPPGLTESELEPGS